MHCYLYERLANLGACYTPIHRCLYFGLSIGLSSNAQVAVLCAGHLISLNIISGHRLGGRSHTHQRRWGASRSLPWCRHLLGRTITASACDA
jgi:hypothetical protein